MPGCSFLSITFFPFTWNISLFYHAVTDLRLVAANEVANMPWLTSVTIRLWVSVLVNLVKLQIDLFIMSRMSWPVTIKISVKACTGLETIMCYNDIRLTS